MAGDDKAYKETLRYGKSRTCQDHPRSVTSKAGVVWSGDLDTVDHAMCCHNWFRLRDRSVSHFSILTVRLI